MGLRYNGVVNEQIRIGHSALFRTLDGLRARLTHTSEPTELVFPAREEEYQPLLGQLDEIAGCLSHHQPGILSIHAPPLRLESDSFVDDALGLARLAERVGASSVTFHPTKCRRLNGWEQTQAAALDNLRRARDRTPVALAVETLGHGRCLLLDDEIATLGLPMVLDTTHVGHERSIEMLHRHFDSIRTIHLSERTEHAMHQRIGPACLGFVGLLLDTGWAGSLVLEYWPWRWACYAEDIARIRELMDARLLATVQV